MSFPDPERKSEMAEKSIMFKRDGTYSTILLMSIVEVKKSGVGFLSGDIHAFIRTRCGLPHERFPGVYRPCPSDRLTVR